MPQRRARGKPPLEYSLLYTATLCMLAVGAVMVYSASSAESLLGSGDPSHYLKRYVVLGVIGLAALHFLSRNGLRLVKAITPVLLAASFALTAAVMLPGIGVEVNGATRWLGAGWVQFQPSELLKLSLVLYAAQLLAARPSALRTLGGVCKPLLVVVGAACALLMKQPDMGTTIVVCLSISAVLIAAGASWRHLGTIAAAGVLLALVFALIEPYRRARLMSFLDPWQDAGDSGFQSVQAMIAIGSGGFFGVGLGESVQKIFYLPEAHTDMILAIIGEELGVLGVSAVAALYGMIAYAGFRAAKLARDRYSKLLAAGITSLILCQATLNFFAVLGLAPLTGVPLPFISYGNTNLVVMLAGMGLLMNVAATGGRSSARRARPLRAIDGGKGSRAESRDRGRRDRRARRSGAGNRRRATG
jgi:cell division protein FtsW